MGVKEFAKKWFSLWITTFFFNRGKPNMKFSHIKLNLGDLQNLTPSHFAHHWGNKGTLSNIDHLLCSASSLNVFSGTMVTMPAPLTHTPLYYKYLHSWRPELIILCSDSSLVSTPWNWGLPTPCMMGDLASPLPHTPPSLHLTTLLTSICPPEGLNW